MIVSRMEAEELIYLDHAATTPMKQEAIEAMLPFFSVSFANASGGYAAARETRGAIDRARRQVAGAIGARAAEIYFTSGGTEANNWAIMGYAHANPDKRHIITTKIEHHAVLHVVEALAAAGYEVTMLDVDRQGRVDPAALKNIIREDTLLVSVMMANNEVGTIQPIRELASIAHAHGAAMHTDAIQTVGHIPVDIKALDVDFLTMSAHKFGGPKGVGALYARSGMKLSSLIYGGAQERGMRAGTENTPGIVGMGCALALSVQRMEENARRIAALRDEMEAMVRQISGVRVNADEADRLPGHLHVSIEGISTAAAMMRFDMAGIAVSSGSACTSGAVSASHVMLAMGLAGENQADIRFTLGEHNTREDIAAAVRLLGQMVNR